MAAVGPGVREIRIRYMEQLYIATFPEKVYVLHAFKKKSQN